jgi:hypothetical protein
MRQTAMNDPYKRDQDDFHIELEQLERQVRIDKAKAEPKDLGLGVHVLLFEATYAMDGIEALEALERKIEKRRNQSPA